MHSLRNVLVCAALVTSSLSGCGRVSEHTPTPEISQEVQAPMTQVQSANPWQAGDMAIALRRYEVALFLGAVRARVQPATTTPDLVSTDTIPAQPVSVAAPSSSTASVMACIRGAESGNYTESTHPESGSGAYQFVPGTWQHWFGLWRDAVAFVGSDYPYAYQAPPLIQDAVTEYTLTHGGSHNWDPSYGADSCTVGMP